MASGASHQPSSHDANAPDGIQHLERHGYLFGLKLANSWSPFLHDVVYKHLGLSWGQFRLDSADMSLFLRLVRHPDFYGTFEDARDETRELSEPFRCLRHYAE